MRAPSIRPMPGGGFRVYGGIPTRGTWEPTRGRYTTTYKGKTYRIAPLVCEAFHGPRPKGYVCIHIDEDAANNRPDNLRWGTQKENLNCPKFLEYCRSRKGEDSPVRKGAKRKAHG